MNRTKLIIQSHEFEKCMALSQIYFLNLFRKVIGKQITPLRFLEILNYNEPYITKQIDSVLKMNLHHLDKLYVNNSATIAICYIQQTLL